MMLSFTNFHDLINTGMICGTIILIIKMMITALHVIIADNKPIDYEPTLGSVERR